MNSERFREIAARRIKRVRKNNDFKGDEWLPILKCLMDEVEDALEQNRRWDLVLELLDLAVVAELWATEQPPKRKEKSDDIR